MPENFLKHLQYEKRYSPHTLTAYEEDLHQLFAFLAETFEITEASEIKHTQLRNWVAHLVDQGIKPRSVNRKIACLKSYFKFQLGRGYVEHNPAGRLRPLKTEKQLPSFVKESEMTQLLDQVTFSDDFSGLRDKIIIELLYGTGIRLSELIGLKTADINWYNQTIKVLGKRNKERVIPISHSLVQVCRDYLKSKKEMWGEDHQSRLLVTDKGQTLYPGFVQQKVKNYLSLVTTQSKRSPHVLRHTYATHLLNNGAELNAVKDLLGHTSLAATQVYTHNSIEKLKRAFEQAHPKA